MIGKIGYKRSLVILILAGVLGVLFVANEYLFKPKVLQSRQELNVAQGEISTLQGELDKMRADYTQFEKQKNFFDVITRVGFFSDQDRVLARERFDTMQKLSKIISAKYEIKAARILTKEVDPESGYVIMDSPIAIQLEAIDDLDIYRFIYFLNYGFPGHITIDNLMIERKEDVSPDTLRSIGTGNPRPMVAAKMDMHWRTMARKDTIKADVPTDELDPGVPGPGQAGASQ
jgi:hypothetical protein